MKNREPYASVTFTPSEEIRRKLIELKKETGNPISDIVLKCVDYSLRKVELKAVKKDIFFPE